MDANLTASQADVEKAITTSQTAIEDKIKAIDTKLTVIDKKLDSLMALATPTWFGKALTAWQTVSGISADVLLVKDLVDGQEKSVEDLGSALGVFDDVGDAIKPSQWKTLVTQQFLSGTIKSLGACNGSPCGGTPFWRNITGELTQISVGSAEHIWGVNSQGHIYRYVGGNIGNPWQNIDGLLTNVAVGSDGTVMGVNRDNIVYRLCFAESE